MNKNDENIILYYTALRTYAGTSQQPVIYLHGVIEITHNSSLYNVPIQIYIPPTYPTAPPSLFVIETPSK